MAQTGSANFILERTDAGRGLKRRLPVLTCRALVLGLLMAGALAFVLSFAKVDISLPPVVIAVPLLALGAAALSVCPRKIQIIGTGIWAAVLVLCPLVLRSALGSGKNVILNAAIDVIGEKYPYLYPVYKVTVSESAAPFAAAAALIYAAAVLSLLGLYLLKSGDHVIIAALMVVPLLIQAASGLYAGPAAVLAGLFGLVAVWLHAHLTDRTAARGHLAIPESLLMVLVISAMAGGILFGLTRLFPLRTPLFVSDGREAVRESAASRRFDGGSDVLPEGDFRGLGVFEPTEEEVLTVTMSEPASYYLRGFIGDTYTRTGWTAESDGLWAGRDLFYWLHELGFYDQEQLALAAQALSDEPESLGDNVIRIENRAGSSRYYYVPYELKDTAEESLLPLNEQKIGDMGLLSREMRGARAYSYRATAPQVTHFPTLASKLVDEENLTDEGAAYKELEGYYNEFAYAHYLDMPEGLRTTIGRLLGPYTTKEGEVHAQYVEAKQNILYLLTADYEYKADLEEPWTGGDFIAEFLSNTKKGYAPHFASAAVMMFRYYGIPARYVEGYLVTPADAEKMTPDEPYSLDETHAHAWVEYYQDGVGWLPFEITPSYLNVMEKAEDYQDISSLSGAAEPDTEDDEDDDSPDDEESDEGEEIDWYLILEIILLVLIGLFLLMILIFILWVIKKRRDAKKAREAMSSPDNRKAVEALFTYTMNILAVAGLRIRNTSLYRYGPQIGEMFGEKAAARYEQVVDIRQKAVYSTHEISDEERAAVRRFRDAVWRHVYENGSALQKFQMKYIYFL